MTYSVYKTIRKVAKWAILFAIPMLVNAFIVAYPAWAQLSIGAALVAIADALKHGYGVRLP